MSGSTKFDNPTREFLSLTFLAGLLGGIGGGIAFGILTILAAWFSSQANTLSFFSFVSNTFVKIDNPVYGAIIHFLIAIFFGLVFGILLILIPNIGKNRLTTIVSACVYSFIIWATLAKTIPSLVQGTSLNTVINNYFNINSTTWEVTNSFISSLIGHLLYGFFLGLIIWYLPVLLAKRSKKNINVQF